MINPFEMDPLDIVDRPKYEEEISARLSLEQLKGNADYRMRVVIDKENLRQYAADYLVTLLSLHRRATRRPVEYEFLYRPVPLDGGERYLERPQRDLMNQNAMIIAKRQLIVGRLAVKRGYFLNIEEDWTADRSLLQRSAADMRASLREYL